jgi:DNA-binding LacI/PurR family transcriptional regulator
MSLPRGSDTARRTERRQAKQLKKPTSLDVARLVGVSQSAVSRAFTEGGRVSKKTRERILKAAKEIGYVPNLHASSLITRRTGMIALIMGDITNPFYPEVLETFARRLQSAGKRVMLLRLSRDEPIDWALPHVLQYQVDGIIIATAMPGQSVRELCARAHAPVVLFNRAVSGVPADAVCCDNSAGGRIVADILLDSGHKRFGFIAGLEGASTSGERERGFFERVLSRTGEIPSKAHGDFTYEGGKRAALTLFVPSRRPDALFVANDIMALGALDALRIQLGLRVPDDVSLVGFDDIAAAAWPTYGLTTFRQPIDRMVEETLRLLGERISNPNREPATVLVPGRLIPRASARLTSLVQASIEPVDWTNSVVLVSVAANVCTKCARFVAARIQNRGVRGGTIETSTCRLCCICRDFCGCHFRRCRRSR